MALTQISTAGVKDDAVTSGKIPANAVGSSEIAANAVGSSELADNAVDTAAIADDAVTNTKIGNNAVEAAQLGTSAVTTAKIANDAVTNAKIPDNEITLAKLVHGTSSNNGKFLRANNGADPTFETVSGTTINSNADNKIITGSGTANTLEAESLAQIDSGGDLWIGHAPTTHHTNRKAFFHQPTSSESCYISITSSSSSENAGIVFGDSVANDTGNYESYIAHSNTTNDLSLYTNQGGKHLRIKQGGNVEISDGDLVIGTAGHGISFAADGNESGATGELLDDYETGTYTAHFAVEGQGNMSMSGRVGRYTRVGNVVTVMGGGRTDGVSGASSGAAIEFSNLPFPVFNTSSGFGHPFPVKLYNLDSSGLNSMSGSRPYIFKGRLFTDGTHGRIEGERSDSAQNSVNSSLCLSNTSEIHYMFTYITDA